MENRRADKSGRREEDKRWLKVQKTFEKSIAEIVIDIGKLTDHVDELDDHLRGVAGRESLDTRVALAERQLLQDGVLLRQISDQFGDVKEMVSKELSEMSEELSVNKVQRAMTAKTEETRAERFKEWLKFWGPILLAGIALFKDAPKMVIENWDKIAATFDGRQRPMKNNVDRWMEEIERRKKDPKTKAMLKERYGVEE